MMCRLGQDMLGAYSSLQRKDYPNWELARNNVSFVYTTGPFGPQGAVYSIRRRSTIFWTENLL